MVRHERFFAKGLGVEGMHQYVTLQRDTPTQNSFGEPVSSWGTVVSFWANIRPLTGREIFEARQLGYEATHDIECRYVSGMTPKDRIVIGSRVFNIIYVLDPTEVQEFHVARCAEAL